MKYLRKNVIWKCYETVPFILLIPIDILDGIMNAITSGKSKQAVSKLFQ